MEQARLAAAEARRAEDKERERAAAEEQRAAEQQQQPTELPQTVGYVPPKPSQAEKTFVVEPELYDPHKPQPPTVEPQTKRASYGLIIGGIIALLTIAGIGATLYMRSGETNANKGNVGNSNVATPVSGSPADKPTPRAQSVTTQSGIELVYIPAGSFTMGSTNGEGNEKPAHQVTIGTGFHMGKYEVTQGQWQAVMRTSVREQRDKANSSWSIYGEGANYPMYYVSWNEAQEFISKLNARGDGYVYRLPSEAEWEYACRAGTSGDYAGNLDAMGWYSSNSNSSAHPVGSKQPNSFGLYDMHGNVYEWCEDWYHGSYAGAPTDGSAWVSGGAMEYRVLRGGSWFNVATFLPSAHRNYDSPALRVTYIGFRVAASSR